MRSKSAVAEGRLEFRGEFRHALGKLPIVVLNYGLPWPMPHGKPRPPSGRSIHFEIFVEPTNVQILCRPVSRESHHASLRCNTSLDAKRRAAISCEFDFHQIDSCLPGSTQSPQRQARREFSVDGSTVYQRSNYKSVVEKKGHEMRSETLYQPPSGIFQLFSCCLAVLEFMAYLDTIY